MVAREKAMAKEHLKDSIFFQMFCFLWLSRKPLSFIVIVGEHLGEGWEREGRGASLIAAHFLFTLFVIVHWQSLASSTVHQIFIKQSVAT